MSDQRITPLWFSSTCSSWMGSRRGAIARIIRSQSPRVPTREYERRKWSSANSLQAAANSRLSRARSPASRRRHAGSSFRKVNLTKCRSAIVHRVWRMRRPAAPAAALAVLLALLVFAAPAAARGRVMVAFIPQKPEPKMPLLFDLAERNFAYGVTSPTLGGYTKRQMLLDMSQGTRIANNAYPRSLGRLDLVMLDGGGRLSGWAYNAKRAKDAPGDTIPGLLGQTLDNAGLRIGYAGVVGFEQTEATVAVNMRGRGPQASLGTLGTVAPRALAMWARADFLVARFPPDEAGLAALDQIDRARRPGDLIYAVRAPPAGRQRLLPSGMLGSGFHGNVLWSGSTRRTGLIAATDVAPPVLDFFGLKRPRQVEGRPIQARNDGGPEAVRKHIGRLNVVLGRRGSAIHDWFYVWLGLLGVMWFARR